MRLPASAVTALLALLVLPAAAHAATIEVISNELHYTSGAEANNATLTFNGASLVMTDNIGVVITPGTGCSNPELDNTATCSFVVNKLIVDTGGGTDWINVSSSTLPTFSGMSVLNGGDGRDNIDGTKGPDQLVGGGGDDSLEGGQGADRFLGGDGDGDSADYSRASGPVTVDLTPGTANDGLVAGTEGDDANFDGTVENVLGGPHGDHLTGNDANNLIYGGDDEDTISGRGSADTLYGGFGTDTIDGDAGDDVIDGDFFGEGAPVQHDLLDGGPGNDTVSYQLRFEPVHIDLTGAGPQGSPGENEVLDSFESAEGGAADDVLIGNAGANRIVGGFGDDLIDGGLGADDLEGTSGDDTVSYAGRTAPVTVDLDEFFDVNGEASEADFVHNFDNVRGGAGADHLSGTSARNVIEGGGGADVIGGRGGADELHGGDGGDAIDGGGGPDYLYGDAGADTANGGAGDDSLRLRDNEADSGDCAGDVDTAVADAIDALAGCETADNGVAPSAPAPQPQQQQPPPPVPDTTAPRLAVGAIPAKSLKRKAFLKGVRLTLTCDEACSLDVELRGSARSVRLARAYDVVLAQSSLGRGAGARKLKLKPNRKLTGKARRLTVQLRVVATDAAGNRTTVARTLKVR